MRAFLFLLTSSLVTAGQFSTSLGDSYPYQISAITTDSAGNTYVVGSRELGGVGETISVISEAPPPIIAIAFGNADVFVSKLDPNGKLLFTDIFAGKGVDTGTAIALDPSGNIYIAGTTTSPDFPLSKPLQSTPNTNGTGFIVKLSNDGSTILYSTYFGGTLGPTAISSIATDPKGNLYLTGTTTAADFPHTSGMPFLIPAPSSDSGVILTSISAAGDQILYSGAIFAGPIPNAPGSTINTSGVGVAVDASGNAYFSGNVGGAANAAGAYTGILAKVSAGATSVSNLVYLPQFVTALAVDSIGDAYLGYYSYQGINGPIQISIAKLTTSLGPAWTNNLNGLATALDSLAVDASGNVWATGSTDSSSFPNANGWTTGPEFLVALNPAGTKLTYSALYPAGTIAQSVAVDPTGLVHAAGRNGFVSVISPAAAASNQIFTLQNGFGGSLTARISPAEVISIYGPGIGPATPVSATPTAGFFPTTLSGVQVTLNGVDLPLLYVSANQINAVVPMKMTLDATAALRVVNGSSVSADYPVWILPFTPQAFPTVLNQDGTVNSQSNPARSNTVFTFYATGWQSTFGALTDGQVATSAENFCLGTCQVLSEINVAPTARVLYAGLAPGIVAGVTQFNIGLGPVPTSGAPIQFYFDVIGNYSLTQSVWISQ